jgi:hypothetical protein
MVSTTSPLITFLGALFLLLVPVVPILAGPVFRSRPIGLVGDLTAAIVTAAIAYVLLQGDWERMLAGLGNEYASAFAWAYLPFAAFLGVTFVRSLIPVLAPGLLIPTAAEPTAPVAASAPRPASPFILNMNRAVGFLLLAVIALVYLAKFLTKDDLPACDSRETRDALSQIFQSTKVDVKRYDDIKTISTSPEANTCAAALTLANDSHAEVDYKIAFNEKKEAQVAITAARDK